MNELISGLDKFIVGGVMVLFTSSGFIVGHATNNNGRMYNIKKMKFMLIVGQSVYATHNKEEARHDAIALIINSGKRKRESPTFTASISR